MSFFRALFREPRTSLPAILMLAFGIGSFAWMLALHRSLMLRSLPVPEPSRLVSLYGLFGDPHVHGTPSPGELKAMRRFPGVFEGVAGSHSWTVSLQGTQALPFKLDRVTPDYFDVLRVQPALGRGIHPDDARPGAPLVLLLTHGAWLRHFGGDPAILGRDIRLDGVSHRVAGILPREFRTPRGTEAFAPFQWTETTANAGPNFLRVVARLRPGVGDAQVRAALGVLTEQAKLEWRQQGAPEDLLRKVSHGFSPLAQEQLGKGTRVLKVLQVATGLILLLAVLNATAILMARGLSRRRDLAVHAALGADPRRLRALVVKEGVLLGLVGAILGLGLAAAGLRGASLALGWSFPELDLGVIRLDLASLAWVSLVGPLVGGLCALLALPKIHPAEALKAQGRGLRGGSGARRWLVAGQLALATALLGATFAVRTGMAHLLKSDLGYDGKGAWSFEFRAPSTRDAASFASDMARLRDRLAQIPGVRAAGLSNNVPLTGFRSDLAFIAPSGERLDPEGRSASAGAMEALGLRLLQGRAFTPQDGPEAPKVAVLNRALARQAFGAADPLGRTLRLDGEHAFTVVGLVADHRELAPGSAPMPTYWVPLGQSAFLWNEQTHGILRTGGSAPAQAEVARAMAEALPGVAMHALIPLERRVQMALGPQRMARAFLGTFALLALLLAAGGVFGLMAAQVAEARPELAVRSALGAEPGILLRDVLRASALLSAPAGLAGALAGLALERSSRDLLGPWPDPGLAAPFGAFAALLAAALLAALLPALRAARTDPAAALRNE